MEEAPKNERLKNKIPQKNNKLDYKLSFIYRNLGSDLRQLKKIKYLIMFVKLENLNL